MNKLVLGIVLLAGSCACAEEPKLPIADGPFKPSWESLKQYRCPDWFRDAKFGIWAHWGPQSVPRHGDWYAQHVRRRLGRLQTPHRRLWPSFKIWL